MLRDNHHHLESQVDEQFKNLRHHMDDDKKNLLDKISRGANECNSSAIKLNLTIKTIHKLIDQYASKLNDTMTNVEVNRKHISDLKESF